MRIQLWSYNYDPEPTGIAPVSTVWAKEMLRRGHRVEVVAAHPHYPEPRWGYRLLPYRETRDGVPVLRLPIWPGRGTAFQRLRQEMSFTLAQTAAVAALGKPDAVVSVSPSFPALVPAMIDVRLRRIPWLLWLQDLLPDGAAATGLVEGGALLRAARRLERAAYERADHIVVISETFKENLLRKGVPEDKITRVYNWPTRPPAVGRRDANGDSSARILCMGNIGHSQGLPAFVRAFEAEDRLAERGARFVIAGTGVAADAVRDAISTERVEMRGLLPDDELDAELGRATLGAVTQRHDGVEFNVPSKLMNYMASGLPVVASVRPGSEVARLIEESGAGWTTDAAQPAEFARKISELLDDREALAERGAAGARFAEAELRPDRAAEAFERILQGIAA